MRLGFSTLLLLSGFCLLTTACSLDEQPPILTVGTPAGPQASRVRLPVFAEDVEPGLRAVFASVDGRSVPVEDGFVLIDTAVYLDGVYDVVVYATDRSIWRNRTTVTVPLTVDHTPPQVTLTVTSPAAGRSFELSAQANEPVRDGHFEALGQIWPLVSASTGLSLRGFGAMALGDQSPQLRVQATVRDLAGNSGAATLLMPVADVSYPVGGFIQLNEAQTAARADTVAIDAMHAARTAAMTSQLPVDCAWRGPFWMPVEGRGTSGFGKLRDYSDGAQQYHAGLDIAAPSGQPVVAAAAGTVVLAEAQVIYGNVVIVAHGAGVSTTYNHLSQIDVQVGDNIEVGRRIGRVGSTGQSTGPHLHWEVAVGGVLVDPREWVGP